MVARGNIRSDVGDYTELYAPVAFNELVQTMLAVDTFKGWYLDYVDVKGAFLHATLPDADCVWILLPPFKGFPSVSGQIEQLTCLCTVFFNIQSSGMSIFPQR